MCVCVYTTISLTTHLLMNIHGFHVSTILNNAAMYMGMYMSFLVNVFIFFKYISKSGIARSYGSYILNFFRNVHTVFHSAYTSLHSHQEFTNFPFSPHPHHLLLFLIFSIRAILIGMKQYLIVVLFHLRFLWWLMMPKTFSCSIGHLYIFFGKVSIQVSFMLLIGF